MMRAKVGCFGGMSREERGFGFRGRFEWMGWGHLFLLEFRCLSCEATGNHENKPDRFGGNHPHRLGDFFDVDDRLRQAG